VVRDRVRHPTLLSDTDCHAHNPQVNVLLGETADRSQRLATRLCGSTGPPSSHQCSRTRFCGLGRDARRRRSGPSNESVGSTGRSVLSNSPNLLDPEAFGDHSHLAPLPESGSGTDSHPREVLDAIGLILVTEESSAEDRSPAPMITRGAWPM